VMVSESTRDAAGRMDGVDWGRRELHWLRNVSEPVGTYLVAANTIPRTEEPLPGWRAVVARICARPSPGGTPGGTQVPAW
jgi:hypothetical protein